MICGKETFNYIQVAYLSFNTNLNTSETRENLYVMVILMISDGVIKRGLTPIKEPHETNVKGV